MLLAQVVGEASPDAPRLSNGAIPLVVPAVPDDAAIDPGASDGEDQLPWVSDVSEADLLVDGAAREVVADPAIDATPGVTSALVTSLEPAEAPVALEEAGLPPFPDAARASGGTGAAHLTEQIAAERLASTHGGASQVASSVASPGSVPAEVAVPPEHSGGATPETLGTATLKSLLPFEASRPDGAGQRVTDFAGTTAAESGSPPIDKSAETLRSDAAAALRLEEVKPRAPVRPADVLSAAIRRAGAAPATSHAVTRPSAQAPPPADEVVPAISDLAIDAAPIASPARVNSSQQPTSPILGGMPVMPADATGMRSSQVWSSVPAALDLMNAATGEQSVESQIVQAMRLQWRGGVGEARVTLRPEHLGTLSIALRVEQGAMTAVLHAEQPHVRAWVQANEGLLREGLASQGLTLERLVVSEDRSGSNRQGPHDEAGRENRQQRRHLLDEDEPSIFEITV